jgi:phosphoketolase
MTRKYRELKTTKTKTSPLTPELLHKMDASLNMFYIAGPGHGGPAIVGNVYSESGFEP